MNLIEKLKILMEKNNIKNLSQLSKEADIPYTTLKSIMDGDVYDVRLSTSKKLCNYFNLTLDELLDDDISLGEQNSFRHAAFNGVNTDGLDDIDIKQLDDFANLMRLKKNLKEKQDEE